MGVDPYYFTYGAEKVGYEALAKSKSDVLEPISKMRSILKLALITPKSFLMDVSSMNSMGAFIAEATIKQLVLAGKTPKRCKKAVFGLTFKENCSDIRNSKIADILSKLAEYEIYPIVVDPWASGNDEFKTLSVDEIRKVYIDEGEKVLIDVKSILDKQTVIEAGYRYWRL